MAAIKILSRPRCVLKLYRYTGWTLHIMSMSHHIGNTTFILQPGRRYKQNNVLVLLVMCQGTPSRWLKYLNCKRWGLSDYLSAPLIHDDVIKWKQFPRYWPFVRGIHRPPVNSPHKGQWRGALMFSVICGRINGWVNNREAGDLRRYRAHYDVIVIIIHREPGSGGGQEIREWLSNYMKRFSVRCN